MKRYFTCFCFLLAITSMYAQTFTRTELPTQLNTPWEILYGPDGFLWVSERAGVISRVNPDNGNSTVVYQASDYFGGAESEKSPLCPIFQIGHGTLGLALHPNFDQPETAFIYLYHSYNAGSQAEPNTLWQIKRLLWDAQTSQVVNEEVIVANLPNGYDHHGGRLMTAVMNGTPYLFLSIGDLGKSEENDPDCYDPQSENPNNFTQDVSTKNGKIHRFNMDGSIPANNPIADNSFYTRGHRNPQGLMFNDRLEVVYNIEHGDRTDDEINVLESGMNYGWKDVRGYHNDNSHPGEAAYVSNYQPHPQIQNDALVEPLYAWCTTPPENDDYLDWCTVAPSGGAYYGSSTIPAWENSLLVVTLKNGSTTDMELYQFKLQENGALDQSTENPKRFFGEDQQQNGRLRDVAIAPNGDKIFLINNGGTDRDKIVVYTYSGTNIDPLSVTQPTTSVYPNPVENLLYLNINSRQFINQQEVSLSTLSGKTFPIDWADETSINTQDLYPGYYVLSIPFKDRIEKVAFVKK